MKMYVLALFAVIVCYSVDLTSAQCTLTCLHNGVLDKATCTCKCDPLFIGARCETPFFTCDKLVDEDPTECDSLPCTSDVVEAICPKKCYCERPSVVTGNCPPCLNEGILDTATCKCTCKKNFIGPRCQFTPNPCLEEDTLECSAINCWKVSEAKFFKCQKKCLCCGNPLCKNSALLTIDDGPFANKCKCSCPSSYTGDLCDEVASCVDEPGCGTQFSASACAFDFVKTICPSFCKVC